MTIEKDPRARIRVKNYLLDVVSDQRCAKWLHPVILGGLRADSVPQQIMDFRMRLA
jgi:hypothetical protein